MNKNTLKRIAIFLTIMSVLAVLRKLQMDAQSPEFSASSSATTDYRLQLIDNPASELAVPSADFVTKPARQLRNPVRQVVFDEASGGIQWSSEPVDSPGLAEGGLQSLPVNVQVEVEAQEQKAKEVIEDVVATPFEEALIDQARASRMAFESGSDVIAPPVEKSTAVNPQGGFSNNVLSGGSSFPTQPVAKKPASTAKDVAVNDSSKLESTKNESTKNNSDNMFEPSELAEPSSDLANSGQPSGAPVNHSNTGDSLVKQDESVRTTAGIPQGASATAKAGLVQEDEGPKAAVPLVDASRVEGSIVERSSNGLPAISDESQPRLARRTQPRTQPRTKAPLAPKTTAAPKATAAPGGPTAALKAGDFLEASQPKLGAHYKDDAPVTDRRAFSVDPEVRDFSPDPVDPYMPYDPGRQMKVYEGKRLNATQRPLIEIGKPWYQLGQLPEASTLLGAHNPISPQFIIFGDTRTAYATATQNGDSTSQIASELNLFWNLQLTGTERFHMFVAPLDNGARNTRWLLDEDEFVSEFDFDVDFGYFEGDLGAIVGGFTGETLPFDLPFAVGVMPLLVQNGVWMEDAFLGVAATIPARNSALLDISNMDITFFAGFDEIISDAFEGEDDAAKMWGMLSFIEATNGYWEIDYAFLEDRTARDRSYHNIGIGFTRRYGRFLSNSTRVIVNAGQSSDQGDNTADGVLLLSENSLITGAPSTIVPYFNAWAGFDRPQSAARAGGAGGVLRNTGILFESDGMTGFPTLDATAQDTFGAALGVNILPNDFSQQLVLEMAALGVHGNAVGRNAQDEQYGVGFRYQLPLTNATILRADGMYGALRGREDVHGLRMELRRKF